MNFSTIFQKKQTIFIFVVLFSLVAMTVSFLQPVTFSAKSKVLVVCKFSEKADSYTFSRESAYLSVVLSEVVATHSFYEEVSNRDLRIDKEFFEKKPDEESVKKAWTKAVTTKTVGDTGIIEIEVTHSEKEQAKLISGGIHQALIEKHLAFHGNGDAVSVQVIDPPIVEKATPNVKFNLVVAFLVGLAMAFAYIWRYPDKEHDLRFFGKKKT